MRVQWLGCLAAAACSTSAPAPTPTAIPLRGGPQQPFVIFDADIGGVKAPVLLDTGQVTPFALILSPGLAARAGALPTGERDFVTDAVIGTAPVRVTPARPRAFRAGAWRASEISTGISSAVDEAAQAMGQPVEAIGGAVLLAGRSFAIDYRCRTLESPAVPPRGTGESFTLAPLRPLPLVSVRVRGRGPFWFAVDTGARRTIVSPATARSAGVAGAAPVDLRGAGGVERAQSGVADIAVGNGAPRRVDVLISDALERVSEEVGGRVDGIAGADPLGGGRLTVDYRRSRLWIEPPGRCRPQAKPERKAATFSPSASTA
jgi:hypothetical protein